LPAAPGATGDPGATIEPLATCEPGATSGPGETIAIVVAPDDPRSDDIRAVLENHLAFARNESPPEHVHALDVDALLEPAVTFFSARRHGVVLGVAALKHLSSTHAELKSMHTSHGARRQGVGSALVTHLLAFAARAGYERVSLETGTMGAFAPARALYAKFGFVECDPFDGYTVNPYSTCMTLRLGPATG
jgi:putative acetyltransferase